VRKLILISAFVLASVSAQAGESRNMTLAAADETKAVETAKPQETRATDAKAPETNAPQTKAPETNAYQNKAYQNDAYQNDAGYKADAAPRQASRQPAPRPRQTYVRRYESDEMKARRIAARYGVYW
jgi:hypothetical protein